MMAVTAMDGSCTEPILEQGALCSSEERLLESLLPFLPLYQGWPR